MIAEILPGKIILIIFYWGTAASDDPVKYSEIVFCTIYLDVEQHRY